MFEKMDNKQLVREIALFKLPIHILAIEAKVSIL